MSYETPNSLDRVLCSAGTFLFRWRNTLFPLLFIGSAIALRPQQMGGPQFNLITMVLGIGIAVLGQAIRCLTIGLSYIKRGGKNKKVYAIGLVQDGIYAHSRNPMYAGNLLIAAGLCLLFGSPWMYGVLLPFFLVVYLCIVRTEEQYLYGRFGDEFLAFVKRVPRFFPRLRGLTATIRKFDFDWKNVVYKEYGTLFSLSVGLYALSLFRLGLLDSLEDARKHVLALASPLVVFLALYLIARYFKKAARRAQAAEKTEAGLQA